MASFTKEISKSVTGVAQATNIVVQSVASIAVSTAEASKDITSNTGLVVNTTLKVIGNYAEDTLRDSQLMLSENDIRRDIKLKALAKASKNTEVIDTMSEAYANSFLKDVAEELE